MIAILVIALAAGSASALMYASVVSGALISLLLFCLAPLPLMVAALGWGPLSATIGGITAAAALGAIFGLPHCIAFAVTVALPAWWLGHLVLLGRPLPNTGSGNGAAPAAPNLEWYPLGRILLWIAGFAVLTTMTALFTFGTDAASITGAIRELFQQSVQAMAPRDAASTDESERLIDAIVTLVPITSAIMATAMLTLNLWLAAKITKTSGRLHRSWPDLKSTALPPMALAAMCVAVAFCFAGGLLAIVAQVGTAALMMSYALAGFAVLHTLTLGLKSRALWLACTYAIAVVTGGWPVVLAMLILGVTDAVFGIRQRYLRTRPPPLPAS
jgi:hypothetical protein